jgi:hypothetical protein
MQRSLHQRWEWAIGKETGWLATGSVGWCVMSVGARVDGATGGERQRAGQELVVRRMVKAMEMVVPMARHGVVGLGVTQRA